MMRRDRDARQQECLRRDSRTSERKSRTGSGLRGNFTVEACILFPLIFFLLAWMLQLSIGLTQKVELAAADLGKLQEIQSVEDFRETEFFEHFTEELRNQYGS